MTRIIPRELIRHLEWSPEKEILKQKAEKSIPPPNPAQQRAESIDALITNGKYFYSNQKNGDGNCIGVAAALQDAYDQIGSDGIIASLPYLIAGKAKADMSNYLWEKWFSAHSEENAGIDRNGKLVGRGQGIVLTIHGGGILTPMRIMQAYSESLTSENAARYSDEEFENLLNGMLPSGESINLYTVDEVMQGRIPDPFGRYGVWMPAETAKSKPSGKYNKENFMNNELVIARAGTLEYLEEYFEKAKAHDREVLGNWHILNDLDFRQPQGSVLFVDNRFGGLHGNVDLDFDGQFVAVALEDVR